MSSLSANTGDFAEDGKLHPDLAAEVRACPHEVTLLTSVEEFLEKYVPPADQALAKAQQNLADPTFKAVFEREVSDLLGDPGRWPYYSAVTLIPGKPEGVLSGDLQMIGVDSVDVLSLEAVEALEFDPEDGIAVLTLAVKAELMLDLLLDKGDAYWLLESKAGISFYDFDYNESYAAGQSIVFVVGEMRALFKQGEEGDEFEELEFISLDDLPEDDLDHPAAPG